MHIRGMFCVRNQGPLLDYHAREFKMIHTCNLKEFKHGTNGKMRRAIAQQNTQLSKPDIRCYVQQEACYGRHIRGMFCVRNQGPLLDYHALGNLS